MDVPEPHHQTLQVELVKARFEEVGQALVTLPVVFDQRGQHVDRLTHLGCDRRNGPPPLWALRRVSRARHSGEITDVGDGSPSSTGA
jgi:hypothetical protein